MTISPNLANRIMQEINLFRDKKNDVTLLNIGDLSELNPKEPIDAMQGKLFLTQDYLMFLCFFPFIKNSKLNKIPIDYFGILSITNASRTEKINKKFETMIEHPYSFLVTTSDVVDFQIVVNEEKKRFSRKTTRFLRFTIRTDEGLIPFIMTQPEKKYEKWLEAFNSVETNSTHNSTQSEYNSIELENNSLKFCSNCGHEIEEQNRFCKNCGNEIRH